jgi:N-acetylglucosamine-6-sulfatase
MRTPRTLWLVPLAAAAALAAGVAVTGGTGPATPARAAAIAKTPPRPNVVFILTDDLSWNLVRYLPRVQALQRRGTTFSHYFVTDSLCCPSRASIFTGRLPHNTDIFTNMAPDGGFKAFRKRGEEQSTYATALHHAGYRTGMMGKYLNGYLPHGKNAGVGYVPPGWSQWDVAGNGYAEFKYGLNQNHRVVHYGARPQDYLTDVLAQKGEAFIARAATDRRPFALELATFAPHKPSTPAPRDAADFPGLRAPRGAAFDKANLHPPAWLRARKPLSAAQIAVLDVGFRKRAQSVQAVDDLIGRVEGALKANGLAKNTYIVFSSDNGFHLGEHRLLAGKMTAFDTDIRVPLVVAGPGVPAGRTETRLVENIDLRPTFAALGHAPTPPITDGHSFVSLLRKHPTGRWRTAVLVEHHGPVTGAGDPDLPVPGGGNPTSYEAMRTAHTVYIEYHDGEHEYYDLTHDPAERDNTYGRLTTATRKRLQTQLAALEDCHGARECWAASLPR